MKRSDPGDLEPQILGKKEGITEGEEAGRAGKTNLPISSRSGSATAVQKIVQMLFTY